MIAPRCTHNELMDKPKDFRERRYSNGRNAKIQWMYVAMLAPDEKSLPLDSIVFSHGSLSAVSEDGLDFLAARLFYACHPSKS